MNIKIGHLDNIVIEAKLNGNKLSVKGNLPMLKSILTRHYTGNVQNTLNILPNKLKNYLWAETSGNPSEER